MPAVDVALCIDEPFLLSNRTPSEARSRNPSTLSSCFSLLVLTSPCQIHGEPRDCSTFNVVNVRSSVVPKRPQR